MAILFFFQHIAQPQDNCQENHLDLLTPTIIFHLTEGGYPKERFYAGLCQVSLSPDVSPQNARQRGTTQDQTVKRWKLGQKPLNVSRLMRCDIRLYLLELMLGLSFHVRKNRGLRWYIEHVLLSILCLLFCPRLMMLKMKMIMMTKLVVVLGDD